ncbi:hypothetical protein D3C77_475150 [compost metagenome]
MSFVLTEPATIRLNAQLRLSGRFSHTLYDASTKHSVEATIETELCQDHVQVTIRMASTVNSLSLPNSSVTSTKVVAAHLEAIANGRLDTAGMALADALLDEAA